MVLDLGLRISLVSYINSATGTGTGLDLPLLWQLAQRGDVRAGDRSKKGMTGKKRNEEYVCRIVWISGWRCWEPLRGDHQSHIWNWSWKRLAGVAGLLRTRSSPSASPEHTARTPSGYGPGTLRGNAALLSGIPPFPWPVSASRRRHSPLCHAWSAGVRKDSETTTF